MRSAAYLEGFVSRGESLLIPTDQDCVITGLDEGFRYGVSDSARCAGNNCYACGASVDRIT